MGDAKRNSYLSGFGNQFHSEALPGAVPTGQNSPQKPSYGLYPEQISGTAFTALRGENLRSWFYRIRPSVVQGRYEPRSSGKFLTAPFNEAPPTPEQLRWDPLEMPTKPTDFLSGLFTVAGNGSAHARWGCAVHLYAFNQSMESDFFYNADGEMLFVLENGGLTFATEFGELSAEPMEIAVIPRGVKFQIRLNGKEARGYLCENYGHPFRLPYLGVIGANSCADARDFLYPTAKYEDRSGKFKLVTKFQGALWETHLEHSPLDVVGWHGNYAPYKYDLRNFQPVGAIRIDHPDPSIWTVMTSPTEHPGVANADFVIFPPRWAVAENTFRPPWYHRNCMSEYMGLIQGVYDAKQTGFVPGGGSLHNCMAPHGPDSDTFEKATEAELTPKRMSDTMAFMIESFYVLQPTAQAMKSSSVKLQHNYLDCWKGLKSHFNPKGGRT